MKAIVSFVKLVLRFCRLKLSRYTIKNDLEAILSAWLKTNNIDLVLDIGANCGQFGKRLRNSGYKGLMISFEPLKNAHEKLLKEAEGDSLWKIPGPVAIGEFSKTAVIHQSRNSESSSLLEMLPLHLQSAPESQYVDKYEVQVKSIDEIYGTIIPEGKKSFVKIDVQGYEWQVLSGAKNYLKQVDGVLLELSILPLYEGQKLYQEFIKFFSDSGFYLYYLSPNFQDETTGRVYQFDAFFVRKELL